MRRILRIIAKQTTTLHYSLKNLYYMWTNFRNIEAKIKLCLNQMQSQYKKNIGITLPL